MGTREWLFLVIGVNIGIVLLIFTIISALVGGFVYGYLKATKES